MTYVDELRERLGAALSKIDDLEEQIADLEMEIDDLKQDAEDEDDDLYYEDDCPDLDEDPRYMEMREFLRDIGFDPDSLPGSLGERMAIARLLEAASMFK